MQKSIKAEIIVIANSITDEIFAELDDITKIVLRGDCNSYFVPIIVALQNAGMNEKIDSYFMERFQNGCGMQLLLLYPEVAIFSTPKIEIFKAWFLACEDSINTQNDWFLEDIGNLSKYIIHALQYQSISDWFFRIIFTWIEGNRTYIIGYEILLEVIKIKDPPPDIIDKFKERFSAAMNNYNIHQVDNRPKPPKGGLLDRRAIERIKLHKIMIILFPEYYTLFLFCLEEPKRKYEDAIKSLIGRLKDDYLIWLLKTNEINRDNHLYYHDYLTGVIIKIYLEDRSAVEHWEDFQIVIEDHLYKTLNFYRNNSDLSYEPLISLYNYIFEKSQIPDTILGLLLIEQVPSIAGVYECDLALVLTIFKNRQVPEKLKRRLNDKLTFFENLSLNLKLMWIEFYAYREIPLELELHISRMISTYCDSELINDVLKSVHHLYKNKKLPNDLRIKLKEIPKHGIAGVWVALIFSSIINFDKDQQFNRVVAQILLGQIENYHIKTFYAKTGYDQISDLKSFLNFISRTNDLQSFNHLKNILYKTFFSMEPWNSIQEINPRVFFIGQLFKDDVIESFPEELRSLLINDIADKLQKSGYMEFQELVENISLINIVYRRLLKSIEEKNKYLKLHIKSLEKLNFAFWRRISPLSPDSDILIIPVLKMAHFPVLKMTHLPFSKDKENKIYSNFFGQCEIHHRSELSQI